MGASLDKGVEVILKRQILHKAKGLIQSPTFKILSLRVKDVILPINGFFILKFYGSLIIMKKSALITGLVLGMGQIGLALAHSGHWERLDGHNHISLGLGIAFIVGMGAYILVKSIGKASAKLSKNPTHKI